MIAADNGDANAMMKLFFYYAEEKYGCLDIDKAVKYLKMSANENFACAQYVLGELNYYGKLVPKNMRQAYWFNSLSLEKIDLGLYRHGCFLLHGIVVQPNYSAARLIFEKYADSDDENKEMSLYYLALIHFFGLDVEINLLKANKYYQLSLNGEIPKDPFLYAVEYSHRTDSYLLALNYDQLNINREELISMVKNNWKEDYSEIDNSQET